MVRPLLPRPWMHRAYDLALAVLVAYTTLFYDTGYDQLIGLSMALAVVFRRRAPLTVMAIVAALALTQYLLAALAEPLAGELTGYDIAVLIAMVTVVSHAEEMWKAYTAGGIVVVGNVLAFAGISSLSSAADKEARTPWYQGQVQGQELSPSHLSAHQASQKVLLGLFLADPQPWCCHDLTRLLGSAEQPLARAALRARMLRLAPLLDRLGLALCRTGRWGRFSYTVVSSAGLSQGMQRTA